MKATILATLFFVGIATSGVSQNVINGAWRKQQGSAEVILILKPHYFTVTEFDKKKKSFVQTWGGVCALDNDGVAATIEFHSGDKQQVGRKISFDVAINNDMLITNILPGDNKWKKVDDSSTALSGLWVITGREQNGTMNTITPGERKTIKILSGKRFQWVAINTGTGEFFGTGGGTYTFENGIYTEKIEFFSRDSSRVGRALNFRGYINGIEWDHSGKSSKGDPVHEIWTRQP